MLKRFSAVLAAGGLLISVASGCSSSNSDTCPAGEVCTPVKDSGSDAKAIERFDDSPTTEPEATTASLYDGTTGIPCTSDATCQPAGGPGVNICSIDYEGTDFKPDGVSAALFATPVCMLPIPSSGAGSCDPGTDPTQIHFCDGPDDLTQSPPGLCVPNDFTAPAAPGICYPLCTFATDGSAPTGCAAHNACLPVTFLYDSTTSTALGVGYCVSACQKDSDCTSLGSTFGCQTDIGYCTQNKVPRTKTTGQACSTAGTTNDNTTGACLCDSGTGTAGYCSALCVTGGTACPGGWTCDSGEVPSLDFSSGTTVGPMVPITKQNSGLVGICSPSCSLASSEAGTSPVPDAATSDAAGEAAAVDAGSSSCPSPAACMDTSVVGPDCVIP